MGEENSALDKLMAAPKWIPSNSIVEDSSPMKNNSSMQNEVEPIDQ